MEASESAKNAEENEVEGRVEDKIAPQCQSKGTKSGVVVNKVN